MSWNEDPLGNPIEEDRPEEDHSWEDPPWADPPEENAPANPLQRLLAFFRKS